jgi:eukaryotic-like serine/threonine-protein kinase
VVASRYEIQAHLGSGGMGAVFRAHDRALDETVAIKVLRSGPVDPATASTDELERGEQIARRFRSEVKLAWKVRHRNVCGIHEYGEDGDLLFISMELVEGQDLRRILRKGGALVWDEAYDVCLQIAEGLQAIHQAGVIHRDLKPANIMRDPQGVIRVMDFGIAKAFQEESDPGLTGTDKIVGSPDYMSPEQVRGGTLDARSDIYALGILIYEVFTGRVPFRGDRPAATMLKHLEAEPPLEGPAAEQIPSALVPVLRKALSKNPSDRYSTCAELIEALEEARAALGEQHTDSVASIAPLPWPVVGDEAREPSPEAADPPRPQPHPKEARLLIPQLLRALQHADGNVRRRAAAALGTIGPDAAAAAPSLAQLLHDPVPEVREEAATTLKLVGKGDILNFAPEADRPAVTPDSLESPSLASPAAPPERSERGARAGRWVRLLAAWPWRWRSSRR